MRALWALALWGLVLPATTRYEIDVGRAASRTLFVTVDAECPRPDCDFQMPVWNATYQVRDFSQHVTGFEASRPHRMVGPSRWRVQAMAPERVRIRYRYFADAPGPFGAAASARHVFLNFAQVLVYPVDRIREPLQLRFRNVPQGWKTALELPERDGAFHARNYDELADAPAELSAFAEAAFTLAGRRLRVVVDAEPGDYDLKLLSDTAHQIASAATRIMDDVPFPGYTFLYHFRAGGGGGMEHANSTAIDARAPCRDCSLASVTAHEFFHLWNVKRIRPQSLEPIDYTRENLTPSLWFAEGVTSTYATYILLEAGLEQPKAFLERLGSQITRYEQTPARLAQSAEESSIAAWLERYPSYRRPSRSVSYYLKGELAGYLLDLAIRRHSGNRRSLDDVMRRLNTEYAKRGRFFEDTEALERLATEAAGHDMRNFFDDVIRRPAPIAWDALLGYAGLRLESQQTKVPTLGIEAGRAPGQGVTVGALDPGGPGDKAGLRVGDRLVAVNGRAVERSLEQALGGLGLEAGVRVTVEIERRGQTLSLTALPESTSRVSHRVVERPDATAEQKAIRAGWLRERLRQPL